ncbi:MAG: aldehyde dehydrogenase [Thermoactinomyces sp.]
MDDLRELLNKQKSFFHEGKTREAAVRLERLRRLRDAIHRYEPDIITALKKDLNKSEYETYLTELGVIYEEIKYAMKHLKTWTKPKRVKTPLMLFGSKSYIYPEPYGVSLIISPWNYPFQLTICPLIGAIAAGNCVVLKPSELAPHMAKVVKQMLAGIYESEFVAVVEGGIDTSSALLELPFDHIFFTGSSHVGKIVMEKAAKSLIPVTLELGGKSPVIVTDEANLELAARRIVWGKFINAGQTCVAPDFLYVHEKVKEELITRLKTEIARAFGENPLANPKYTRIINERHFARLAKYLTDGKVIYGGEKEEEKLLISPTLLDEVTWEMPVMQDEIFGPILPIFQYKEIDEVIQVIREKPKPLALYLFTENRETEKKVIDSLSFGGGTINDTLVHLATPYLPFGGVGTSGIGSYHGKFSFDCFTHQKSIVKQSTKIDFPFRYHFSSNGLKWLKRIMK